MPTDPGHRRKLRNYLIDAHFQLRAAAYAVALTLVVSGLLGAFLYRTTTVLFEETAKSVEARAEAAEKSKELGNATLANQLLEKMNDPAFETQLKEKSAAIDRAYEQEAQAVRRARENLVAQQKLTLWVLVGGLALFVIFVGCGAIVVTHRVVGPLFRVRRIAREVQAGRLEVPTHGLRPGDEFQEVFEELTKMLEALRSHDQSTAAEVTRTAAEAEKDGSAPVADALHKLAARLRARVP